MEILDYFANLRDFFFDPLVSRTVMYESLVWPCIVVYYRILECDAPVLVS